MEESFDFEASGGVFPLEVFVCKFAGFIRYIESCAVKREASNCFRTPKISRMRDRGRKQRSPRRRTVFALESTAFRSAKYYFSIMAAFDFCARFSPVIDSISYRYSVGLYHGGKRVIIAWFADESSAIDYLARCRFERPHVKYDYLRSLF